MISDIILCADNICNWSRSKTSSEDHVKNGELTRNTSTIHQPLSPLHRNKERLKDTEVLKKHRYIIFILASFTFYIAVATVDSSTILFYFNLFYFIFYFMFYVFIFLFCLI